MNPSKRAVLEVCVWLGGDDPREQQLSPNHAWLVPGPSFLNSLIAWAHPPAVTTAAVAPRGVPR
jgi:hypothetical protein